jgi:hypothetical protein
MHPYHNILEHRHRLEQGEILEGASNPERRDMIRSQRHERPIFEENLAPGWGIEPTETVKEGRFTRAVRANEANNVPLCHLKRDAIQSDDTPELDGQILDAQEG